MGEVAVGPIAFESEHLERINDVYDGLRQRTPGFFAIPTDCRDVAMQRL
ncbi:hypothetical protein [Nostoc sp. DSM 114161]